MSQSKTPKIRFPEFTEEWQKKRLDEIFTERKESCIISEEYPQLAFTIAEGVINPEDKKTNKRDFLIKDIETKKFAVTEVDDIIYNPANLKFGAIHRNKLKRGGVSPIYAIFSTEQLPAFMEYLVKRPSFIQESLKYLEGTVIKLMTLKPRDFLLMETYIPSIPEQEKIADLFTTLDSYIEIETKKTDSYKTLKASMLQKMFPQQDSLEPEIRFPGFTEPWEQRKVLDLLIQPITDGPHETPKLVEEGVPFISVDAIVDNKIDFNRKRGNISEEYDELCCKKYKPQFHDVYLVKSGSTVGKVAIVETTDRFNIWSPLAAMRCGEKTYPYFLYDLLQTKDLQAQVADKASNGTQPNLSMRELEKFPVSVPSNLEEQKKIGDYFRNLDHLITLHQRKCEQLQLLKHALQQKMFV